MTDAQVEANVDIPDILEPDDDDYEDATKSKFKTPNEGWFEGEVLGYSKEISKNGHYTLFFNIAPVNQEGHVAKEYAARLRMFMPKRNKSVANHSAPKTGWLFGGPWASAFGVDRSDLPARPKKIGEGVYELPDGSQVNIQEAKPYYVKFDKAVIGFAMAQFWNEPGQHVGKRVYYQVVHNTSESNGKVYANIEKVSATEPEGETVEYENLGD